ncbi:transcription factor bHLH68, partial [Trifolium medium]|nr:transcription factor bHLH68 [Trifolium medium]
MDTVTVTTRAQILRHITAFTASVINQSELRRSLIETLHRETPISNQVTLKQLNLAADA